MVASSIRQVLEADEAWWDEVLDVNLKGHFLCSVAAAHHMAPNGGGTIITMSSGGATRAHRGMVAYDASKGGIEALTRALALDLAPYGIRVVGLVPGLIVASPEVNADVAHALGSDAERLGSIERVTAERHGAIRLGTPQELAQAAQVFAAMGMHPVGFYDLRDAKPVPVPVVSTAFRPVDPEELALDPFRVFTSLLAHV